MAYNLVDLQGIFRVKVRVWLYLLLLVVNRWNTTVPYQLYHYSSSITFLSLINLPTYLRIYIHFLHRSPRALYRWSVNYISEHPFDKQARTSISIRQAPDYLPTYLSFCLQYLYISISFNEQARYLIHLYTIKESKWISTIRDINLQCFKRRSYHLLINLTRSAACQETSFIRGPRSSLTLSRSIITTT